MTLPSALRGTVPRQLKLQGSCVMYGGGSSRDNNAHAALQAGADVEKVYPRDKPTPLSKAVSTGNEAIVEALLGRQARADVASDDGSTPLMIGSWKGFTGIVQQLLQVSREDRIANLGWDCYTALGLCIKIVGGIEKWGVGFERSGQQCNPGTQLTCARHLLNSRA